MERIVLAYAGGFDPAAAIASLQQQYAAEVVAVTMDLGQGQVLEELRDRVLAAGAVRAHVLDLRDTFATNYILPSLRADATGVDGTPQAASLARALVAEKLVEMAGIEQANRVAHGPDASSGSVRVLDAAIHFLEPALEIAAIPAALRAPTDAGPRIGMNLWGRTIERTTETTSQPPSATGAGAGADGGVEAVPERFYKLTRPLTLTPGEAASIELRFERGCPTSVNGVPMPFVELIGSVGHLAGTHGVGRIVTPRAVVEAPAAVVLHAAHKSLQPRALAKEMERVSREYGDIIAGGGWSTPARKALDKLVEKAQQRVKGSVRLTLFKGVCTLA